MLPTVDIRVGDWIEELRKIPDASIQCCVTSPPYFGLRNYGVPGQLGLEKTPADYVAALLAGFREVKRVLRPDGTLWLNLGDSYANDAKWGGSSVGKHVKALHGDTGVGRGRKETGLKPKDLIGIPWRVAFALQADGWWLRSDIIWAKANCMPESVTDRPTRSHEFLFLLTKAERYYYDHEAIKEPCIYDVDGTGTAARKARAEGNKLLPTAERNGIHPPRNHQTFTRDHPERAENSKFTKPGGYKNSVNFDGKNKGAEKQRGHSRKHDGFNERWDAMEKEEQCTGMRNKRDVWHIAPANYPEAHFATFPPDLIRPCILAGSRVGDTILDPFGGSGTSGMVALSHGRSAILIELNPDYAKLAEKRCHVTPGLPL